MQLEILKLYEVNDLVRTCFQRFKDIADRLHADLGVTAAKRAVMETLSGHGAQTVPQVARSRGVTRQHIQVIMDELSATGLVEQRRNPVHKRSPIYALTPPGRVLLAEIERREISIFEGLAPAFDVEQLESAAAALSLLNRRLIDQMAQGESGEG